MPHYKDGTPAAIGDIVRGKGYNVKDRDGNLAEFVGTVVGITPGSSSCNIQVAYVVYKETPADFASWSKMYEFFDQKGVIGCGANGGKDAKSVMARVSLEYGQCDHFELLHRPKDVALSKSVKAALQQAASETKDIREKELAGSR